MSGKKIVAHFLFVVFFISVFFNISVVTTPVFAQQQATQQTQGGGVIGAIKGGIVGSAAGLPGMVAGVIGGARGVSPGSFALDGLMVLIGGFLGVVGTALTIVAGFVLFLTGMLFDVAVSLSTSGLSEIVNGVARQAIDETWKIFRDLANIGFVFVLLYIAIKFILNADTSNTKSMLSNTIIAALLVNFSFFFAALVVDVSNQLAMSVKEEISKEIKGSVSVDSYSFFVMYKSSTGPIVEGMGIVLNNVKSATEAGSPGEAMSRLKDLSQVIPTDANAVVQWMIGTFLSVGLLLTLAIVFLIAAFMLISRTIIIIFLLITSPIGFVGRVLPITEKLGKKWWESLFGHAFSLPVFLLFILVAFKLMNSDILKISAIQSPAAVGASGTFITTVAPTLIGPLIQYAIIIGLFIGALAAAKEMTSMGISLVSKLSGQITSTVGGAALGTAGFAGRQTAGRVARKLADNDSFKNWSASNGRIGQYALQATKYASGASFDVRSSKGFKGVASATGIGEKDLGAAGGKGGYAATRKAATERSTNFAAESLGLVSDSDGTVSGHKASLDAAQADLKRLKYAGATKAQLGAAQALIDTHQTAYTTARNARIAAYGTKIGARNKYLNPGSNDASRTIAKELAKALQENKYDIVKALKAAKGDKKEE